MSKQTLLDAVCKRDVNLVRRLLAQGADPNAADEYGLAPLHVAAMLASPLLVELLLQHGADPNCTTSHGETPLLVLSRMQRNIYRAARLLENAGASHEPVEIEIRREYARMYRELTGKEPPEVRQW